MSLLDALSRMRQRREQLEAAGFTVTGWSLGSDLYESFEWYQMEKNKQKGRGPVMVVDSFHSPLYWCLPVHECEHIPGDYFAVEVEA